MFQCLLAFLNEVVSFSIASMASSTALIHLPLMIRGLHILTLFCFLAGSCSQDGGTFFLSWLNFSYSPLHLLQGTLIIMIKILLVPTPNMLGVCYLDLQEVQI
jgi:hypothetical protein